VGTITRSAALAREWPVCPLPVAGTQSCTRRSAYTDEVVATGNGQPSEAQPSVYGGVAKCVPVATLRVVVVAAGFVCVAVSVAEGA